MTGETSLEDQVKTLQRQMGLMGRAFKDISEKVKHLEVKNAEIKEDETEANTEAFKKLEKEIKGIIKDKTKKRCKKKRGG